MNTEINFTIVTVPLAFSGSDVTAQRNAILSWTLLKPRPEILLLANEHGVAEFAKEHGLVHIPDVEMTKFGVPSIRSILEIGQANSSNELMVSICTDNILMSDFPLAVWAVSRTFDSSVMVGFRRSDTILHSIPFENPMWEEDLKTHMQQYGTLFRPDLGSGADYFVFHRGFFQGVPDFSIGKGHWDGWIMRYVLDHGAELLDCSDIVFCIHQDHIWRHWFSGAPTQDNLVLAGGDANMRWIFNATRKLTQEWLGETIARLSIAGE